MPECPFQIEWSAEVLHAVRMAAVDAFLSLPHGGAEIGGVLWGTRDRGGVHILAARPLECEHALGPTFALSDKDNARLRALLDEGCGDLRARGLEPVGWYHSHTRSEIFLSAQDLEIHDRYFPESWQVALVIRPHIMQPVRAGFFFREAGGGMHADSSYHEFVLKPVNDATLSPPSTPSLPGPAAAPPVRTSVPAVSAALALPKRRWPWLLACALMIGLSAALFPITNHGAPPDRFVSVTAYDLDGQLQIHYDRAAVPVRSGEEGSLEITDGEARTVILIEGPRLRRGTVSYTRAGARVDIRFTLQQPGGNRFEEFATFVGHPLAGAQPDQAARALQLERDVAGLRLLIRQVQHRR